MLVVEDQQKLILKLKNPGRVLTVCPNARAQAMGDTTVVVADHDVKTVAALRSVGMLAPAPILHYYKWSGHYTPMDHQRETAAFLTTHQRALVLNEIGTGKSLTALWAADYLLSVGEAKRVLILSPLSTVNFVWKNEIFAHFPHRRAEVLSGTAEKKRSLLRSDAEFFIVNHESFHIIASDAVGLFDIVIIDEAAVYRTPTSKLCKRMLRWLAANPHARVWPMTGTPTPRLPSDAWALGRLVQSQECPLLHSTFKSMVEERRGPYNWQPKQGWEDIVRRVLTPAMRVKRSECLDLPGTTRREVQTELTETQQALYSSMMKELAAELKTQGSTVVAANEAVKLGKLVQIACGVLYTNTGDTIELDCAPRVQALKDAVEEVDGKVIVFAPLTGVLTMLQRELSARWSVALVNGATPAAERSAVFSAFQKQPDPHILLAHPKTMAHGLTLTAARSIIWYGPITSNETFMQAEGRVERPGKTEPTTVIQLSATAVEREMYRRLGRQQKLQNVLLDLLKKQEGLVV